VTETNRSQPLSFAAGQTMVLHFPAFTPRITFHANDTLTVEIIEGENAGVSDTIPYRAVLREKLVVLSWKEQVGSTVVHVLDRDAGQTYTLVAPVRGGLFSLEGTIERD
jgi:hypothetical protein